MDKVKDDAYYAKRILKNIEVLTRYLAGKSQDDLLSDGYLCDAIRKLDNRGQLRLDNHRGGVTKH